MTNKNNAIERIDEIYNVIQKNFLVMLPGKLLITIGTAITMIPFIELFLSTYIDPQLINLGATQAMMFLARTVFYWTSFTLICKSSHEKPTIHPAIKRAWGLNDFFPILPITTAAMLAFTGNTELIMPMVLILVGCLWMLIGRFTSPIITGLALSLFIAGIAGIYLSTLGIPHLWKYLLMYQGISCFIAGLILHIQQNSKPS